MTLCAQTHHRPFRKPRISFVAMLGLLKPNYPPFSAFLSNFIHDIVIQGTIYGILLALLWVPVYRKARGCAQALEMSDSIFFALLLGLTHAGVYATNVGFYTMCDRRGWLLRYKLPRSKAMAPSMELIKRTRRDQLIANLFTFPIFAYGAYFAFEYFGMKSMDAELPSKLEMGRVFARAHLVNDLGFYWVHRLGHHCLFYRFHKKHHEFRGVISEAAEHSSLAEKIFNNFLPTLGGVLFWPTHPLCVACWLGLRLHQAYENHSGYCFEGTLPEILGICHANAVAHHDWHHTVNMGNYGVTMWTDWVFGTMCPYQNKGGFEAYIDIHRSGRLDRLLDLEPIRRGELRSTEWSGSPFSSRADPNSSSTRRSWQKPCLKRT